MAMLPMMDLMPLSPDLKPMVLGIMNEKYPAALGMYVRHYGKKSQCSEAKLIDVTGKGFVVSYKDEAGEAAVCKLPFLEMPAGTEVTCNTVGAARRAFVEMARHAAEQLGESIDLPPPSTAPPSSPEGDGQAEDPMQALAMMMAMLKGKGKGKGEDGESDPMADLMAAMLKGKGKGSGGSSTAPPAPGAGNIRTLGDASSSGDDPLAEMMAQLMAAKGKGKGSAPAEPADPWANLGAGNRLDGGSSSSATAPEPSLDEAELAALVRPVDSALPTLSLRVRLPDRTQVTLTFNACHTIAQVRAFLQVHHPASFSGPYTLMDTGGFPPKKLADLGQTLEEAGVKSGSSLDCRKA
eukprot:TRINITY_DN6692_c0_g1_i1.p1 TRINITY_DN6692_c0_g1~~TRINITY_DN6692_c0_g1_i1.p1  ORF type:complete len:365 (+),score=86.79 TRINITY_DN6692_c0_g1_i1:42-1097(+)